jgi:hypothetical protein
MHATCEDTAKHDPQIGYWAKFGTHDSTKDRAGAGDVEKLDHEDLPIGEHDMVNPVGLGYGWGYPVIRAKHLVHEATIKQITKHKCYQANSKCNHLFVLL